MSASTYSLKRQELTLVADGKLAFESQTLASNVNILFVNETDPTLFHDFSTYTDSILDMSVGEYCTDAPDFAAEGWAAGTNVTMLIIWQVGLLLCTWPSSCAHFSSTAMRPTTTLAPT